MKRPTVEFYIDAKKHWRWRLRAANGRILADSGEGYATEAKARRGFRTARDAAGTAERLP